MTFEIDTGAPVTNSAIDYVPDWFRDQMAADAPPARVAHDFGYHLIGALNNPKTIATIRKHTLQNWAFWRCMADEWPEVFDEFWMSYAERLHDI